MQQKHHLCYMTKEYEERKVKSKEELVILDKLINLLDIIMSFSPLY